MFFLPPFLFLRGRRRKLKTSIPSTRIPLHSTSLLYMGTIIAYSIMAHYKYWSTTVTSTFPSTQRADMLKGAIVIVSESDTAFVHEKRRSGRRHVLSQIINYQVGPRCAHGLPRMGRAHGKGFGTRRLGASNP